MSSTPVRRKSKPSKPSQPPHRKRVKEIERPTPPFIHLVRLIICGLGTTTIVGTAISVINPPSPPVASKGKLPSPPKTKLPIPVKPVPFSSPKAIKTPQPKPSSPAPPPKNSKLDVKPTPTSTVDPGFPKTVFIKPAP